jgi:hypothetical protein
MDPVSNPYKTKKQFYGSFLFNFYSFKEQTEIWEGAGPNDSKQSLNLIFS